MKIGIVGAGIGGLVAAAGLNRDGHDVKVFERRSNAAAVGAGLTLFPNSFSALEAIGLDETARQVSSTAMGKVMSGQREPSGRWLLAIPPSTAPQVWGLHRSDLHNGLIAQFGEDKIQFSQTASVAADGSPVITANGNSERFDLVIAADGISSSSRSSWGLDRGTRYAGYTAWRGIVEAGSTFANATGETWGAGQRFGIVPIYGERVYWFATRTVPPGGSDPDPTATLRSLFAGWHAPISELIEATNPATILRHDIYDLARFPTSFVHSRCVLLGDAAHAMTPDLGQGAGQAIEDAATLTVLLRGLGPEAIDTALSRYNNIRTRRTFKLWRQSRITGRVAQASSNFGVRARTAVLRAAPSSFVAAATKRVGRWQLP